MPDSLPRRGADLVQWSANFDRLINASPESYSLSAGQAAEYTLLHDAFASAYQIANHPAMRTSLAIIDKNDAEKALRANARILARIIRASGVVSDGMIFGLGLHVAKLTRTRIPRPNRAPNLRIDAASGNTLTLRLADVQHTTSRAKPGNAKGAAIFIYAGEHPPASRDDWSFAAHTTQTNAQIHLPAAMPAGTKVWITASWHNNKGNGPLSTPIFTHSGYGIARAA